jgi:uncharacterized protein YlxP (DUF503 family)
MIIGACRVTLRIEHSQSLKAKRQVVQSLVARVRDRFPIAIAEVDDLDAWQAAVIGFACLSNDERHASEMVSNIVAFIERLHVDAEVLDIETEVIHAL